MKNLFKNLMLVAVAAMAFTACQNDNSEIDTLAKTRVVTFTANIGEDTRSGFTGKVDNVYKSAWDGGEMLMLIAESTSGYPTISADGTFEQEFNESDNNVSIYAPVAAWTYNYISGVGYGYYPDIPKTQTPRANSVDPAAHILSAQNVPIGDAGEVVVSMQHAVAYGKMTVKTPAEFEITKVVLNLKGINQYEETDDLTYTINATNVENNEFWFATEPLKVSEFTITAHGSDGKKMTKTVAVDEDKLNFNTGRVSTFSVGNLIEQEAPKPIEFTSVVYNNNKYDKQLTFTSVDMGELKLNFYPDDTDGGDYLNVGHYDSPGSLFVDSTTYAYFKPVDGSAIKISYVSADISIVDGKYMFVFHVEAGDYVFDGMYHGLVDGLSIPDTRTKLATPVLSHVMSDSMTAIVSWEPIDNAAGYRVYYTGGDGFDTTTTETSITLEFTKYGEYYVNVGALAAEGDPNYKDSAETYVYILIEDPRPYLTVPSNVSATVDGTSATISWADVEGADYYQVYYYLNGNVYVDVDGTSTTLDLGYGIKDLWVYVFSKANDDNPNYRSSNSWSAYVVINTENDPNFIAQYMWDETFVWDDAGYFILTDSTWGSSSYWRIYLNSENRPNNNSIKPGKYAGTTSTSPAADQFTVRIGASSVAPFYSVYASYLSANDSLEVKVVDGMYQIVFTYGNDSYGYKGLPYGFVLPN